MIPSVCDLTPSTDTGGARAAVCELHPLSGCQDKRYKLTIEQWDSDGCDTVGVDISWRQAVKLARWITEQTIEMEGREAPEGTRVLATVGADPGAPAYWTGCIASDDGGKAIVSAQDRSYVLTQRELGMLAVRLSELFREMKAANEGKTEAPA